MSLSAQSSIVRLLTLTLLVLLPLAAWSQGDPGTGVQLWSTNEFGIDLASSNIYIAIPIRAKTAGPMPMSASLIGNFHAYNNDVKEALWTWTTVPQFNAQAMGVPVQGAMPDFTVTGTCNTTGVLAGITLLGVYDATGAAHVPPISPPSLYPSNCSTGTPNSGSIRVTTTDGSGYTVIATDNSDGSAINFSIYDSAGNVETFAPYTPGSTVVPPQVAAVSTPDGVSIQGSISNVDSPTLTDPLSSNPFLAETTSTGLPLTETYSYTNSTGGTEGVAVTYAEMTVRTKFGCSSSYTKFADYGPVSHYLPTTVTLPGGNGSYAIVYEETPGYSGDVTGRIQSITYPAGGSVSYAYSGGTGNAYGYDCVSQIVPTINVTTKDNIGNVNVWTYVNNRAGNNSNGSIPTSFTVTRTDPAGNQTVYSFAGAASTSFSPGKAYQTQAQSFQGSATGTPLKTILTCYNGNFASCKAPTTTPALPITQTNVYTSFNGSPSNLVETKLDPTYGNVLEVKRYDFGVTLGTAPTGSPLSDTLAYYGQSWNGTACTAYPSGTYIFDTPCYSVTNNSARTTVAATQITYSNTGHPTTTTRLTSGSSTLTSSATYNANGTVNTATDVNGAVSTYAYNGTGGCNGLLPTSASVAWTAPPAGSLTTGSTQWNCDGGVATQTADPNGTATGKATTYTYNDPLWRIKSMTDPMGDVTNYYYPSPTESEAATNFATTSTSDVLVTSDGLGRPTLSQTRQAQGSANFDSVQYAYGWTKGIGAATFVSMPYVGTAGTPASGTTAATETQNDALGRPITVTDGGGGTTTYQYVQNDVLQSVGPSQTFARQFQYNGMGQLTSVCEVNSLSGSGACGQTNGETGYLTTYSLDPLSNILSVNEAGQTRTYTYDGLSRMTYEKNPESGVTQYFWDAAPSACGSGGWSTPGDIGAKEDNRGIYNCYGYDGLHRLLGVDSGGASENCRTFYYDSPNGTPPAGIIVQNTAGRLVEAYTNSACNGIASLVTDEWFSYDVNGRNTDLYQSTPNSGGYYHTTVGYWANNTVNTLSGVPGLSGWTYKPDGEGRLFSATYNSPTPTDWVTGATYFPIASQPTVTFGNGDSDVYSIDNTTGRMSGFQFTVGSTPKTLAGTLNWNANWTLGSMGITDGFNAADTQSCGYAHDALSRISSVACTNSAGINIWGTVYTFDAFGNITKTVPTNDTGNSFQPTYSASTNQYTLSGCTVAYDAAGHLTNDCFNTYTWDVYGDPITIGAKTITYDALGREAEIESGSKYTQVLYSPLGKLGLMNGQTPSSTRFPLPGGSTAEIVGTGGALRTLHTDWLGSSRLATTYGGRAMSYDVAYSPYGESYVPAGSATTDADFTGQFQDTQTGLYDFQSREYSTVGRWISPDPSGLSAVDPTNPQSWNRYAYVLNNPLSYKDLLGLYCDYSDHDDPSSSFGSSQFDYNSNSRECADNGGQWVDDAYTQNGADLPGRPQYAVSSNATDTQTDVGTTDVSLPDIIALGGCSTSGGSSSASSAIVQYLSGAGSADQMSAQFASGLGPSNRTFGPGSVESQMMASSPGVTSAVNSYLSTGQSNGLYTFGASAVIAAGINPIQQFVGSYTYNITPGNGGLNVSLSNYTSVWSGSYHLLRSHQRSSFRPFGTTHQTYQVFVPCS